MRAVLLVFNTLAMAHDSVHPSLCDWHEKSLFALFDKEDGHKKTGQASCIYMYIYVYIY